MNSTGYLASVLKMDLCQQHQGVNYEGKSVLQRQ